MRGGDEALLRDRLATLRDARDERHVFAECHARQPARKHAARSAVALMEHLRKVHPGLAAEFEKRAPQTHVPKG